MNSESLQTKQEKTRTKKPLHEKIETFKNIVQDCNINFLIGSGLSVPFMGTLGEIENWLTDLERKKNEDDYFKEYDKCKAFLYKRYFDVAMKGNDDILAYNYSCSKPTSEEPTDLHKTYEAYRKFLGTINIILYERRNNTINKQVNLFTTNIDIFFEKVLEDLNLQFNDGFSGIFKKEFSLSNFKRSFYQNSLHYDNITEIPAFNLLKIHGSVTWKLNNTNIEFVGLEVLKDVIEKSEKLKSINFIQSNGKISTLDDIIEIVSKENTIDDDNISKFITEYEKLQIVNPTKDKFRDITLNKNYYEMLRLYSNELEKENSVLFIMGFSMADEHIREITFRAIKSNPTLKVFICSYDKSAEDIKDNLSKDKINLENFHNVELLNPIEEFDLQRMNELLFSPLLESFSTKNFEEYYEDISTKGFYI